VCHYDYISRRGEGTGDRTSHLQKHYIIGNAGGPGKTGLFVKEKYDAKKKIIKE